MVEGVAGWPWVRLIIGCIGQIVRQLHHAVDNLIHHRQEHLITAGFEHQRVAEVIDIFEVQAKWMNSLAARTALSTKQRLSQYSMALTSWLVSASIALTSVGVGLHRTRPPPDPARQWSKRRRGNLSDCRLGGQRFQPFDFDTDAVVEQGVFTENGRKPATCD